jgi:hypothetical protein
VGRVLSTAFCVALLAVAAAAFALTEGAKTERSPIYGTMIDKVFSPVCDPGICATRVADIVFALRSPERLEVWMQHGSMRVSTIVDGRRYPRGKVRLSFSGRSADGALLPDGIYYPVVRLVGDHRTIRLPNPIQLDTVPPRVTGYPHDLRALISPTAVGVPRDVVVPYTLSAHGHGVLFADGHRVVLTYREPLRGVLEWRATIDGRPVPAGRYTLEIAVQDAAGNRSKPIAFAEVSVRYLTLAARRISARPRKPFSVRVLIGPARVSWSLAGRRGSGATHVLHLLAPRAPGRYRLYVSGAGHAASALLVVS